MANNLGYLTAKTNKERCDYFYFFYYNILYKIKNQYL